MEAPIIYLIAANEHYTLRSVLSLLLFNVFTDDQGDDKECNISKFAGSFNIERVIHIENTSSLEVRLQTWGQHQHQECQWVQMSVPQAESLQHVAIQIGK